MDSKKIIIAPSLLSCDLSNLESECRKVLDADADWLHLDVMDGNFVPNLTFGYPVLSSLRKKLPDAHFDVHLMITNPLKWVQNVAKTADSISFHYEACKDIDEVIKVIKKIKFCKKKVGLAINPNTQISSVEKILEKELLDYILIMTVVPGFGGQPFNKRCLEKIKKVNLKYPNLNIQVDGGINKETFKMCLEKGANIFVSGSTIFNHSEPKLLIKDLRDSASGIFFS